MWLNRSFETDMETSFSQRLKEMSWEQHLRVGRMVPIWYPSLSHACKSRVVRVRQQGFSEVAEAWD